LYQNKLSRAGWQMVRFHSALAQLSLTSIIDLLVGRECQRCKALNRGEVERGRANNVFLDVINPLLFPARVRKSLRFVFLGLLVPLQALGYDDL
jgi:hypothetical protein